MGDIMKKLIKPIWVGSRWSVIFEKIIPAHMIEYEEAITAEIYDMELEIDYMHPKRKDGERDMRYARNR
jgi:hypothetical protein